MSHVWISITDPEKELANIEENFDCKDILRLEFHDISTKEIATIGEYNLPRMTTKHDQYDTWVPMRQSHAKEIIEFVLKYKDQVELICIHCFAGKCRSAAVGAVLAKWLECELEATQEQIPNRHVMNLMTEEINALRV